MLFLHAIETTSRRLRERRDSVKRTAAAAVMVRARAVSGTLHRLSGTLITGSIIAVIVLMIGLCAAPQVVNGWRMTHIGDQTRTLISAAAGAVGMSEAVGAIEVLQRASVQYQAFGEDGAADEFRKAEIQAEDVVNAGLENARSDTARNIYRNLAETLATLKGEFEHLTALERERQRARTTLNGAIEKLTDAATQLFDAARATGNASLTEQTVAFARPAFAARADARLFLDTEDQTTIKSFRDNIEKAATALAAIGHPDALSSLLGPAKQSLTATRNSHAALARVLHDSDTLYQGHMVPQFDEMKRQLADERQSIVNDLQMAKQDTLGAMAERSAQWSGPLALAPFLALALALMLGRIAGENWLPGMRKFSSGTVRTAWRLREVVSPMRTSPSGILSDQKNA